MRKTGVSAMQKRVLTLALPRGSVAFSEETNVGPWGLLLPKLSHGASVETLRNQRQAVEGRMAEGLHHGSHCRNPEKPTSGRGGQVITGIRGYTPTGTSVEMRRNQRQAVEDSISQGAGMLSPTGATVEMRRNQRQAVVSVVCTGGSTGQLENAPQGLLFCQIQYSGRTIPMRVIHGSDRRYVYLYESDTRKSWGGYVYLYGSDTRESKAGYVYLYGSDTRES